MDGVVKLDLLFLGLEALRSVLAKFLKGIVLGYVSPVRLLGHACGGPGPPEGEETQSVCDAFKRHKK